MKNIITVATKVSRHYRPTSRQCLTTVMNRFTSHRCHRIATLVYRKHRNAVTIIKEPAAVAEQRNIMRQNHVTNLSIIIIIDPNLADQGATATMSQPRPK